MSRDVPSGWEIQKLGALAEIRRGASPRPISDPKWFSEDGPGWVRITDVTASNGSLKTTDQRLSPEGVSKSVLIRPGELIMSICATIGVPIISDIEACIHDGFVVFKNPRQDKIDLDYLRYFLSNEASSFEKLGQIGTQKNLNTGIINATEVPLPPLPEQRRIAAILSSVDEAIQATEAVIEQTRKVKDGVLERLLTKGIGHTEFKETEIGPLPAGWSLQVTTQFCDRVTDGTHDTPPRQSDGIPLLTSKCLKGGELVWDASYLISEKDADEIEKRSRVDAGDIVFGMIGTIGNPVVITSTSKRFVVKNVAIFKMKTEIHSQWLYHFLQSKRMLELLSQRQSGNAQKFVPLKLLRSLLVPVPPDKEMLVAVKVLTEHESTIRQSERALGQIQRLKSALMSDLLTGRKRVTDAMALAAE